MIMADMTAPAKKRRRFRRWVRRGFLLGALIATLWLTNSYRTRGLDPAVLESDAAVNVANTAATLDLSPVASKSETALIFICGSGVAAEAYLPMLRPVAEAGNAVFIVKLPYRFAPLESHKQAAIDRALDVIATHPRIRHWVVAGHSLGGALACRVVQSDHKSISGLVLIGTTHPKEDDLSSLPMPVTKIYGTDDGVAPPDRMFENRGLLPKHTRFVEIEGGNHSQFGHYGHQLFDGTPSISRETQQTTTRAALLEMLDNVAK
jgi:pimeloyl-ACP methyl ester carboxylesterase